MAVKITKTTAPMASSSGESVPDETVVCGAAFAEISRNATQGMSVAATPRHVWPKLHGTMPTRPKRGCTGSSGGVDGGVPAGITGGWGGEVREGGGGGELVVSPSRTDMGGFLSSEPVRAPFI